MSLDSICLTAIRKELMDIFEGGKIVNIFQVEKYKIIFEIKPIANLLSHNNIDKKIKTFYIHISIDPSLMEIYFSESSNTKETVSSPFLTLLQNHLIGGKILDIKHPDFDRILHFIIQPYLKFGQTQNKTLIVEFMGKHSNLILLKENSIIEGSIKLITPGISRYREITPGKLYVSPPAQNKLNPLKINKKDFMGIFIPGDDKDVSIWQIFQNNFKGINQQSAKEIIFQVNLSPEKNVLNTSQNELELLWFSFNRIVENIKHQNFHPAVFLDPLSNKIKAYSIIDSRQFPQYNKLSFDNTNSCLQYLFTELEKKKDILSLQNKLDNLLNKNIVKISDKINDYQKKIEEVKNCEQYKWRGELIKVNLSHIKKGDRETTTINYYSPHQEKITIPLDNRLTPLQNARLYFKKYRKMKDSYGIILKQLNKEQVKLTQLNRLKKLYEQYNHSLPDLVKIYNDLKKTGLVKKITVPIKKQKKKESRLFPTKYISKDGWEIYIGKNNRQNDFLTFKLASGNDLWVHVKTAKGAHVIIKNKGGNQTPPLTTLIQAASLAAYFSKVKNESKVLVDYTLKKYVKKPKNSKPGMVTYSHEKSLLIKVNTQEIKNMISRDSPVEILSP